MHFRSMQAKLKKISAGGVNVYLFYLDCYCALAAFTYALIGCATDTWQFVVHLRRGQHRRRFAPRLVVHATELHTAQHLTYKVCSDPAAVAVIGGTHNHAAYYPYEPAWGII